MVVSGVSSSSPSFSHQMNSYRFRREVLLERRSGSVGSAPSPAERAFNIASSSVMIAIFLVGLKAAGSRSQRD